MKKFSVYFLSFLTFLSVSNTAFADDHDGHDHADVEVVGSEVVVEGSHHEESMGQAEEEEFDVAEMIMSHIADANEFHIAGNFSIPLPVILWDKAEGLKFFLSSVFHHGYMAVDGYVMDHSVVKKVVGDFPAGKVDVEVHHGEVIYDGHTFETEGKSTLLEGSSFYDFSITKNVFSLLLSCALLIFIFVGMARFYKKGSMVPKGLYSALEPLILFVKDEIAIPNIGKEKYAKFLPYLLTVFFFIWLNNIFGLIPFFPGSANLTGNIALTFLLAIITMVMTNVYASKTYWGHIFNPPVPMALKPIMIPIEIVGVISKPFALMIRLFANISAGHILILSLVSLIFVFKSYYVAPVSIAFVLFMSLLEILVGFLQAFIFTLLSALFIGLAQEEHH
ncbi:MAG: F-type H+-transporting ATPase subunit a [Chitinophagales bacterium]